MDHGVLLGGGAGRAGGIWLLASHVDALGELALPGSMTKKITILGQSPIHLNSIRLSHVLVRSAYVLVLLFVELEPGQNTQKGFLVA